MASKILVELLNRNRYVNRLQTELFCLEVDTHQFKVKSLRTTKLHLICYL
jgi:hypothetical protein